MLEPKYLLLLGLDVEKQLVMAYLTLFEHHLLFVFIILRRLKKYSCLCALFFRLFKVAQQPIEF